VPLAAVAALTRAQALYLYHHARDEENQLVPYGPPHSARPAAPDYRQEFFTHYRLLGFAAWRVEQLWSARQEVLGKDGPHGGDTGR